jgi:hypothetical protein
MSLQVERYNSIHGWDGEKEHVEPGKQDLIFIFTNSKAGEKRELPERVLFISGGKEYSRVVDINAILVQADGGIKVYPCNARGQYEIHNGARLTINTSGQRIRFTQTDGSDFMFQEGLGF